MHDKILFYAPKGEYDHLVSSGAARPANGGRCLRLTAVGEEWPQRTVTGRGGLLGAIGRGQKYTFSHTRHVESPAHYHKSIWPEDRQPFLQALIDAACPVMRKDLMRAIAGKAPT